MDVLLLRLAIRASKLNHQRFGFQAIQIWTSISVGFKIWCQNCIDLCSIKINLFSIKCHSMLIKRLKKMIKRSKLSTLKSINVDKKIKKVKFNRLFDYIQSLFIFFQTIKKNLMKFRNDLIDFVAMINLDSINLHVATWQLITTTMLLSFNHREGPYSKVLFPWKINCKRYSLTSANI